MIHRTRRHGLGHSVGINFEQIFENGITKISGMDLPTFAECDVIEKLLHYDLTLRVTPSEARQVANQLVAPHKDEALCKALAGEFVNQPFMAVELTVMDWPVGEKPCPQRAACIIEGHIAYLHHYYELTKALRSFHQRVLMSKRPEQPSLL